MLGLIVSRVCANKESIRYRKKIKAIFDDEKGRAGAPRITRRLNHEGESVGKHRVARIMRKNGWRTKVAKKFKATTNSNHQLPVSPNLLQQNFFDYKPNEKWVSDITCCWTEEGWLYLAVVMDLYSSKVVGWAMSERMTKKLVIDALQMAIWGRKPPRGLIVHSDRGSQYCSHEYQKILNLHGLVCSMSKRGDCCDNAAIGVCQQRCRLNFKTIYFNTSSILTRRDRDLSTAIARAIQALLLKQFCAKIQCLC